MTLNTQLHMSIEHKLQRIHHQHHHHIHYHHIHHLLHHHEHAQLHQQQHLEILKGIHKQQVQSRPNFIPLRLTNGTKVEEPIEPEAVETAGSNNINAVMDNPHVKEQADQPVLTIDSALIPASAKRSRKASSTKSYGAQQIETKSKQRSQIQFFVLAAIAYILSPIDLVPEAIFGVFGIIDDILFLMTCLSCIAIILIYPLFVELRHALFDKLGLKRKPGISNKKF